MAGTWRGDECEPARIVGLAEKFVLNIIGFYFLGRIAGATILLIGETAVDVLQGVDQFVHQNGLVIHVPR